MVILARRSTSASSFAAAAVGAGAAGAALALAVVLRDELLLPLEAALVGVNYDGAIAVSLLHTLALVSAVAVAALVRHDCVNLKK